MQVTLSITQAERARVSGSGSDYSLEILGSLHSEATTSMKYAFKFTLALAELVEVSARLHRVPFSLHNNFAELHSFVAKLRPRAVRGIVSSAPGTAGTDPAFHFRKLLRPSRADAVPVPGQQPQSERVSGTIRNWQVC